MFLRTEPGFGDLLCNDEQKNTSVVLNVPENCICYFEY